MRLPFFGSSRPAAPARPGPEADPAGVEAARTAARRRLIGASVLLLIGVVGFPVLFETQPRPLPADTPYLVPEGTPARVAGVASAARPSTVAPAPVLPADAGTEMPPSASTAATAPNTAPNTAPSAASAVALGAAAPASQPARAAAPARPAASAPVRAAPAAATAAPAPQGASAAQPVQAEKPSKADKPEPAAGRFVVQVGAYNDLERLKAARAKLEKLGFKSYTQDVDSSTGRRTRVRVGPFATRQEAEAVAAKVKGAGMQAAILAL